MQFTGPDFTITKRHLGLLLIAAGLLAALAMVGAQVIQSGGFGALQTMGAALGAVSVLVGLTLLPLGNRPA
ncbi:MAG: hypothetical protein JXQ72_04620 [Anaerolineae bacterium]|nr:hypothetical protein [Anaerolineae bacterium]